MADHIVSVSLLTQLVNSCHAKLRQVINLKGKQRLTACSAASTSMVL